MEKRALVSRSVLRCLSTILLFVGPAADRVVAAARYDDLVDALLRVWQNHDVVCLGEDHGSRLDSDLRTALVSDPRFVETVDLVIAEFVTSARQKLLDRFFLDLEERTHEALAPVWRDTSAPEVWESPIYEAFLRALRSANTRVERDARVRVIGGEVPVDWENAASGRDLLPLLQRGSYPAELIAREVLEPGRKALVIFGSGHCDRREGFAGELGSRYPGRTWVAFRSDAKHRWADGPSLIPVTGTELASRSAADLFPLRHRSGASGTLGDVLDGIVDHGDVDDEIVYPPDDPFPAAFERELERRGRLREEFRQIVLRDHPEVLREEED